ncbi:hypothetical protein EFP27_03865 [Lacticaseibacillus paracasei]|nr:hypothetical protein [Lacticaseibacillus paracasei]
MAISDQMPMTYNPICHGALCLSQLCMLLTSVILQYTGKTANFGGFLRGFSGFLWFMLLYECSILDNTIELLRVL